MNVILLVSIAVRLAAAAWSLVLLHRLRDRRMAFMTATLVLMALRQTLTLVDDLRAGRATHAAWTEVPGFAVSFLAVLAVVFVGRMLADLGSAGEALRRSQSTLQLVMDTIPQRVFWKDVQLNYLGCNQAFAEDAGLASPAELVGRDDLGLAWKDSAHLYRADDRAVIGDGRSRVGYEEPQELADGTRKWLRTTKVPLRDRSGAIVGVFGSYEDITSRKEADEALRSSREQLAHSQRMELVGQLAGGVAHDFNNLLQAIGGNAELLEGGELPTDARKGIAEILKATDRATTLTRQLLAFSRRQVLEPRRVDLNEILRDMADMMRRLVGEQVALELRLVEGSVVVHADPGQLEQVVMNLVVNARDAMPEGGSLALSTEHGAVNGQEMVVLRVIDDGTGMDAATLEHLFEPFFTTKEPGRGTGLGLATVDGIVHQSGGSIRVNSEPGKGSTFEVRLPAVEGPVERPVSRPAVSRPISRSETILVIEDEPQVRDITVGVLSRAGYRVLAAQDGRQALAMVRSGGVPIDGMVVDVALPGESGPRVAARILELQPSAAVLHVSGHAQHPSVGRDELGASEFLPKPFRAEELLARLRTVLEARGATVPANRGEDECPS